MNEQSGDIIDLEDAFSTLKECAEGQWDVNADEMLLKTMMALQTKFYARFNAVRDEVESLHEDTRSGSIQLQNAMNSFVLLAQKQFVQNRVSIDDEPDSPAGSTVSEHSDLDKELSKLPPEDAEARMTRVCQEAIDLGVHVLEQRTMPLFGGNELDEEVDEAEALSQSSANRNRHRRFMAMIGTERFLSDPHGGCGTTGEVSPDSASSPTRADSGAAVEPSPPTHMPSAHIPVATASEVSPFPPAKAQPTPPPPPPAPVLPREAAKSFNAAPPKPPPKRAAAASLFDSSDSSDESPRPDAKKTHFAPAAKEVSLLFAGESSDSSGFSAAPKVLPKALPKALPKKASVFSDDSTSDSDSDTQVRPPTAAAKNDVPVPRLTGDAIRSSVSSSSVDSKSDGCPPVKVMGKAPPPVFSSSGESSVTPRATSAIARTHSEPQPTESADDPLPSKGPIAPPLPIQSVPAADSVMETKGAGNLAAAGKIQTPSATTGKVFLPLPRRGEKVLSSSSESDDPVAVPAAHTQRTPSALPVKPAVKVAPPRVQIYSSESD